MAACLALVGAVTGAGAAGAVDASGADTIDGLHAGTGRVLDGATLEVQVTGRGGVPASGVGAVALNVTVTAPTASTYLTVWPTGSARPVASNLNVVAGQTRPNMVIAKVGTGGKVSIYNATGTAHVIVDVLGWFPAAALTSLTPARLLDTRPGGATVDGQQVAAGALPGGGISSLPVLGRGGVPGSGVRAVAVNVTATEATLDTFVTVWPSPQERPLASNLNVRALETAPNMAIVPVGADGRIQLYNEQGRVHLLVDVLAWFPTSGGNYTGLTPARLLDTRPGGTTVDGQAGGGGALGPGATLELTVTGRGGVPASGVGAVALNVTATDPTAETFLTVWPTGTGRPVASNLNVPARRTVPNMVIAKVGTDGRISLYNEAGATHVLVDVLGWFATSDGFESLTPARLADTRPALIVPVPDDGNLLGIPLGTDAGLTLDLLAARLGPVSEYRDWASACSIFPNNPQQLATARWGMLWVALFRSPSAPAQLYGWSLAEGRSAGAVGIANIELPGGYPWRTPLTTLSSRLGIPVTDDLGAGGDNGSRLSAGEWRLHDNAGAGRPAGAAVYAYVGDGVGCE